MHFHICVGSSGEVKYVTVFFTLSISFLLQATLVVCDPM